MPENHFEIIKREVEASSPQHGAILALVLKDLSPAQIENLKEKAAEGKMALELEQIRKLHQFQASAADIHEFIEHVPQLEHASRGNLSSYKATGEFVTATVRTTIQTKKVLCFVATAVYGTRYHPNVIILQTFRDRHLATSSIGRSFIRVYYRIGPILARSPLVRGSAGKITRRALDVFCSMCGAGSEKEGCKPKLASLFFDAPLNKTFIWIAGGENTAAPTMLCQKCPRN